MEDTSWFSLLLLLLLLGTVVVVVVVAPWGVHLLTMAGGGASIM